MTSDSEPSPTQFSTRTECTVALGAMPTLLPGGRGTPERGSGLRLGLG
jgi:hypothetical protein